MNTKKKSLLVTILVTAAVCLVFATMQGLHDNYGIMTDSLTKRTGLAYGDISFIIGVGAFLYGLAQPFMGMLALKKSNVFVMLLGIVMIVSGLVLSTIFDAFMALLFAYGIILPIGTTGVAFGILMGMLTPMVGDKRAALISGIVQASAGVGDALMAPFMERMIKTNGINWTLLILAVPFALMIPIALWIGRVIKKQETLNSTNNEKILSDENTSKTDGKTDTKFDSETRVEETKEKHSLKEILKNAFHDHDYICILIGFSTCGFNMSIIEAHLFNQYVAEGLPSNISSYTLTVYGVMTMLGALATGYLSTKFKMKNVLGTTYLLRAFISLAFIFLPKTLWFAFIMTGFLGATGDSTVPPTSGTISRKFGAKRLAVLYGFALVGHQIGAFASASLGGIFVDQGWGYTPLWIINLVLAVIAASASYAIREK